MKLETVDLRNLGEKWVQQQIADDPSLLGLGDLILTCLSPQSRNYTFGFNLGRGQKPEAIHAGLAEGVFTASVLAQMARERGVDMPISFAVAALLSGKLNVDAAIESLLTRPFKAEA